MIYIDRFGNKTMYYRNKKDYGFKEPDLFNKEEIILTQDLELLGKYQSKGFQTYLLSAYFGLAETLGLYEIFSYFFDGIVNDDFEMLQVLFDGLIVDSDYVFCLNIGATFCWFRVLQDKLEILGTMQYSYTGSKYSIGKFIKKLRFNIAKSGFNLKKIQYLFWSADTMITDIENYITEYSFLSEFFNKFEGMKGLSCLNIMQLLSTDIKETYKVTAMDFVDCLNQSFKRLNLYEENGTLYSGNVFYKDYSSCICDLINPKECEYGIILDCEGKESGILQEGISKIGGLIFCKYHNILLNVESFVSDDLMLEETIDKVINNFKSYNTNILNHNIRVLVYGTSDETLFQASLREKLSQRKYVNICNKLEFINVYDYINSYIDKFDDFDEKHTLENVAKYLSVRVLKPIHNPLNDARTLFNVLSRILQMTKKFVELKNH